MRLWVTKDNSNRFYPEIPGGQKASCGETYVSYNRLFQILETMLGIVDLQSSYALRVTVYKKKLATADNSDRFYHASFERDQIGVAETLLKWRDELCLGGSFNLSDLKKTKIKRLKDLYEIESSGPILPSGESERIRQILDRLPNQKLELDELVLIEKETVLPRAYRLLIEALKESGVKVNTFNAKPVKSAGNLELVKTALSSENKKVTLDKADKTFLIIETQSDAIAAEIWSNFLTENQNDNMVMIDENNSLLLDEICRQRGLPSQGLTEHSSARPVLQIMPSFLQLLWEPVNIYSLLDFLSLPLSPVSSKIRYKLIEAISEQPGIGGRKWQKALEGADASCLKSVEDYITFQRFNEEKGIPVNILNEYCEKLASWAQKLGQAKPDNAESRQLLILASQCRELKKTVDSYGEKKITKLKLEKLASIILSSGIKNDETKAQAGKETVLANTASLLAETDSLVWFDFTGEDKWRAPQRQWFEIELEEFKNLNIELVDQKNYTEEMSSMAVRAVNFCSKRLIIFIPAKKSAEKTSSHPLYEMMRGKVENLDKVTIKAEQVLSEGGKVLNIETETIKPRYLPAAEPMWQIESDYLISRKRKESYSSLKNLLFYPFIYILQNSARLRSAYISTISEGSRLFGNLSHELIQRFLTGKIKANGTGEAQIKKAIEEEAQKLFEKEASSLLLPVAASERENLLYYTIRSAKLLKELFSENGFENIETEKYIVKDFHDTKLQGYIDMAVSSKENRRAIIDLKYSGWSGFANELKANTALQLLVYSYLYKEKEWPNFAYFLIPKVKLLPAKEGFKNVKCLQNEDTESNEQVWARFEKTYLYRLEQLKKGIIEIPLGKLNASEFSYPEGLLPMPKEADKFNDFDILTGEAFL
ncbi:MAG: PD-(D/E)XK nuclease family protein [Spirochaetia bacterium]|nr:PD-(D/E)XK nuclease family protein [Spirochaetia bacterium]